MAIDYSQNKEKENVKNKIAELLQAQDFSWWPFHAGGLDSTTAFKYADEVMSIYSNDSKKLPQERKYKTIEDAIKHVATTVYGDTDWDKGIIGSNKIIHSKTMSILEKNEDAGLVSVGAGGMIGESPEYFTRKFKNKNAVKTPYALNLVFKNYENQLGEERFISETITLANNMRLGDDDTKFVYGENFFFQATENSTPNYPRFKVYTVDDSGSMIPLEIDIGGFAQELIIDVSDFKNKLDRENITYHQNNPAGLF